MSPKLLPSAFGPELAQLGISRDISSPAYREAFKSILERSMQAGGHAAATDSFWAGREKNGAAPDPLELADVVGTQLGWLQEMPERYRSKMQQVFVSLGPRGDCYDPAAAPADVVEARAFHAGGMARLPRQMDGLPPLTLLAETICTFREAAGAMLAAKDLNRNALVSFVLGTDGNLRDGTPLFAAIQTIDALTGEYGAFGLNCSGIPAIKKALGQVRWAGLVGRIKAVYPNSSDRDPTLLEGCAEAGVIHQDNLSGRAHFLAQLTRELPRLEWVGGCCGCGPEFICMLHGALTQPTHQRVLQATIT